MNFLRFNQYKGLSLILVVLLFFFFFLKHYTNFLHWGMLSSLKEFQVTELPI